MTKESSSAIHQLVF